MVNPLQVWIKTNTGAWGGVKGFKEATRGFMANDDDSNILGTIFLDDKALVLGHERDYS